MKTPGYIAALAVVLFMPLVVGNVLGQVPYTVTDLGALGEIFGSDAYGINAKGQVVGSGDFAGHAFLYSGGKMIDLGTLGGPSSIAYGINDDGQVVGWSWTKDNKMHAFLYSSGKMTDLGTLGGVSSQAKAINAKGQVVGWSHTSRDSHAFVYSRSWGRMIDFGPLLGGTANEANAINDRGQVAGCVVPTKWGAIHGFLYDGVKTKDLGTLGGEHSNAYGINAKGQVVGGAYTAERPGMHAFLYSDGKMADLGTLGGALSAAHGINASGQVVGKAATTQNATAGNPAWHAFLYSDGKITDLNTLIAPASRWTLEEAMAINDNGQIVGSGINPKGKHRAFLLTPTLQTLPSRAVGCR